MTLATMRVVPLAAVVGLGVLCAAPAGARTAATQEPAAPQAGATAATDADRPLQAGTDVPAPKRKHLVLPEYPEAAKALGVRGIVLIELIIEADGSVGDAHVVRSIPGLDEAALAAVTQWEYEPTRVGDKPVRVRLAVPITFSMKLPELEREDGVPELRQGVIPAVPSDGGGGSTVEAEVTLDAGGHVAEALILKGESPWAEALLRALRTWVFAWEDPTALVAFRVHAEFVRGKKSDDSRVTLRATGARRLDASNLLASVPQGAPDAVPTPSAAAPPATEPPPARPVAEPAPAAAPPPLANAPGAEPAHAPSTTPPASEPPAAPRPTATAVPSAPTPVTAPPAAPPVPAGASAPPPPPAAVPRDVPPAPPSMPNGTPPAPPTAATKPKPGNPPVEVIHVPPRAAEPAPGAPAAAAPQPPQPGYSSVRDVTLAIGVPDLTQGRRPTVPPLARMASVTGTVEVAFSVGASGLTSIQSTTGPDPLQLAAKEMVQSWVFRRTATDRLYLVATIDYGADTAKASVTLVP